MKTRAPARRSSTVNELHGPEGYSVEGPLDAGRFFVIFRVARGGHAFICKRPTARFAADEAAAALLRTEAQALARLRGAAAPTVVTAGDDGRGPYLVTTVAPGVPLASLASLDRDAPEAPDAAPAAPGVDEAALASVLRAVAAVHAAGVVHGDLSPSNVLVRGLEVTLVDFALARFPAAPEATPATGSFRGTLLYAAPEVARGEAAAYASDVFSAAAALLHVVTRRPPRRARDLAAGLLEAAEEPVSPALVAALARAAPALGPCLARALAAEPGARPSAAALADEATLLLGARLRGSRAP